MKNMPHVKLPLLLAVAAFSTAFFVVCESSQAGPRHHRYQAGPVVSKRVEVCEPVVVPAMTPEEAGQKMAELCDEIKNEFRPISEDDFHRSKKQALRATDDLIRLIKNDPAKATAAVWMDRLALEDLRKTLLDSEGPDDEVIGVTWTALFADYEGIRWKIFDPLRLALRRYYRLRSLMNEVDGKKLYEVEMQKMCSNLPGIIDAYSRNVIDRQDAELAIAVEWLEDVSAVEPRAARLAKLARSAFSGVNLRIRVAGDFVGAGFQTTIVDEPMDIRENILGTNVVGTGVFSADSLATLVEASQHAAINVNVLGTMNSLTTGRQHPVTLNTKTEGVIQADKRVVISADRIFTTPAQSRAQLQSSIFNVRVDGGPLVQCIARNQVEKRQGASKAESRRRTEMRMNHRIDERIDERIAELNQRYQKEFRTPLLKSGLFPRIFDLTSSAEAIHWSALVGNLSQPSAMNAAPGIEKDAEKNYAVLVQVHQSALNNAAAIALAGNYFEEDKFVRNLKERFKNLGDKLDRPEGEEPLRLTFSSEAPIRLGFDGNKINVLLQVHEFYQSRPGAEDDAALQARRGLTISLTYEIKIEKVDGLGVVVLALSGEPKLSPRLGDGQQFSALSNPIQTVVRRRLKALDPKIVLKPWYPEGEWKGKGKLVPSFASTKDGWLAFGFDWMPTEE